MRRIRNRWGVIGVGSILAFSACGQNDDSSGDGDGDGDLPGDGDGDLPGDGDGDLPGDGDGDLRGDGDGDGAGGNVSGSGGAVSGAGGDASGGTAPMGSGGDGGAEGAGGTGGSGAGAWTWLDPFDGSKSLDDYDDVYPENLLSAALTAGVLQLQPAGDTSWFESGTGALIAREINGDFLSVVHVKVHAAGSPDSPPADDYSLGGLMARNADDFNGQQWVNLSVGRALSVGIDRRTTIDSTSVVFQESGTNEGELRICRVGDEFYLYKQLSNEDSLILVGTYSRPDLPSTLQVGMQVSSLASPSTVVAEFDGFAVAPVSEQSDCSMAAPDF